MALLAPPLLLESNLKKEEEKEFKENVKFKLSVRTIERNQQLSQCLLILHCLQMSRPHSYSESDMQLEDKKERVFIFILKPWGE